MQFLAAVLASVNLVSCGFRDVGEKPGVTWYLLFRAGDHRKAVCSDGRPAVELKDDARIQYDQATIKKLGMTEPHRPTGAVLSPDGRRLAYIGTVADTKAIPHPFHGQVCVCRPDGGNAQALVKRPANRQSLSWSPDGTQIAFDEELEDKAGHPTPKQMRQIHVIDVATGVLRRTFGGTTSLSRPSFTPQGNLLYHSFRARDGKLALYDLEFVKLNGTQDEQFRLSRTLVKRQFMLGAALSPDDSHLAYSIPGAMIVQSLDGKTEHTWKVEDVGKQLGIDWFICFAGSVWRPDGKAVASRCIFIGGRQGGDHSAVKGEEKVIVFPLAGKVHAFDLEPRWALERWATQAEVDRLRK